MNAIILHDREEEAIGTVLVKNQSSSDDYSFDEICERWDKYLDELEDDYPDIYEFVSKGNFDVCEVLNVEFYQPR